MASPKAFTVGLVLALALAPVPAPAAASPANRTLSPYFVVEGAESGVDASEAPVPAAAGGPRPAVRDMRCVGGPLGGVCMGGVELPPGEEFRRASSTQEHGPFRLGAGTWRVRVAVAEAVLESRSGDLAARTVHSGVTGIEVVDAAGVARFSRSFPFDEDVVAQDAEERRDSAGPWVSGARVRLLEGTHVRTMLVELQWVSEYGEYSELLLLAERDGAIAVAGNPVRLAYYGAVTDHPAGEDQESWRLGPGDMLQLALDGSAFGFLACPVHVDATRGLRPLGREVECAAVELGGDKDGPAAGARISLAAAPRAGAPAREVEVRGDTRARGLRARGVVSFDLDGRLGVTPRWLELEVDGARGWTSDDEVLYKLGIWPVDRC